jgi:hypothetical protein
MRCWPENQYANVNFFSCRALQAFGMNYEGWSSSLQQHYNRPTGEDHDAAGSGPDRRGSR